MSAIRALPVVLAALLLAPAGASADVADQVIVGYEDGTTPSERADVRRDAGVALKPHTTADDTQVLVVDGSRAAALRELRSDPDVAWAVADRPVRALLTPSDTSFASQWGLHNTGQTINSVAGTADADMDVTEAWDVEPGSTSVKIGVTDTGFDRAQPDFTGAGWTNPNEIASNGIDDDGNGRVDDTIGWDFYNGDNNPAEDHDHGTAVSSIIAATRSGGGPMTGVAPATIIPAKTNGNTGSGSLSTLAIGLRYLAALGTRAINVSIGWDDASGTAQTPFTAVYNDYPETLFVFAAGNGTSNGGVGVNVDSSTYDQGCRNTSPNLLCVAATTSTDAKAGFSSYGTTSVDIGAPGVNIVSLYYPGGTNALALYSGTSMAAPMVTGVAALLLAKYPSATAAQMKAAILAGGDTTAAMTGTTVSGKRANATGALAAMPAAISAAPASTAAPSVSGTAEVGQTLTATTGSWSGSPSAYAYRWQACDAAGANCQNIDGAKTSSYVLPSAMQGRRIRVQVYASTASSGTIAHSTVTSAVTAAGVPVVDVQPSLSTGTPTARQSMSVTVGSTSNAATSSVAWHACDAGATNCTSVGTGTSLTVPENAYDRYLRATVTWTNASGSTAATVTTSSKVAGIAPSTIGLPSIAGTAVAGGTLSSAMPAVDAGVPSSSTTTTVRWERCVGGSCVVRQTGGTTYQPAESDVGGTIRLRVTVANAVGSAEVVSAQTSAVAMPPAPAFTALPSFAVSPQSGVKLTVVAPSIASLLPYTLTYRWELCSEDSELILTSFAVALGETCEFISEGPDGFIVATEQMVGKRLKLTVTATSSAGSKSVTVFSGKVTAGSTPPARTPVTTSPGVPPVTSSPAPTTTTSPTQDEDEEDDEDLPVTLRRTTVSLTAKKPTITVRCEDEDGCTARVVIYVKVGKRKVKVASVKVKVAEGTRRVRIKLSKSQRAKVRKLLRKKTRKGEARITVGGERQTVAIKLR